MTADTQARDEHGRFIPKSDITAAQEPSPEVSTPASEGAAPDISAAGEPYSPTPAEPTDTSSPESEPSPSPQADSQPGFAGTLSVAPDPNVQGQPQTEVTQPGQPQVNSQIPADPRLAQMSVRYSASGFEKQWNEERQQRGWGHSRPFSCYVGAIGNHWKPRSWAKTIDMVQYANEHGMYVVFEEVQDRCQEPYDALGVMRNEVLTKAEYGGYEYVVMVDNDILPAPDTLFRMLRKMWRHNVSVCAPLVYEPGTGRPLHGPTAEPYTGLQAGRWNVLSMILFKTSVFRSFPPGGFWHDPRGADEGFHYQKLYNAGHHPMLDTEVVLDIQQAPTYPLTIDKQENRDAMWDARKQSFQSVPDRRPEHPDDPRVNEHGIYMPFLAVPCLVERGGCGNAFPGTWWRESPVCPNCQQKQAQGMQLEGTADGSPDGVYRRCKGVDNGSQCLNHTPYAHGFCQIHLNRVGAAS